MLLLKLSFFFLLSLSMSINICFFIADLSISGALVLASKISIEAFG